MDSLRYEENHFYDLSYFRDVPSRSLKIRYAYKVNDRQHPTECKFIYKIPIPQSDKTYRIKSVLVNQQEITKLVSFALHDYERHVLRVFTHSVTTKECELTALIKRYSEGLRTLSLMGPEIRVRELVTEICKYFPTQEIDDPSNYRYLNPALSEGFDYELLMKEELALFRLYSIG